MFKREIREKMSRENVVDVETFEAAFEPVTASHTERLFLQVLFPETAPSDMQDRASASCVK